MTKFINKIKLFLLKFIINTNGMEFQYNIYKENQIKKLVDLKNTIIEQYIKFLMKITCITEEEKMLQKTIKEKLFIESKSMKDQNIICDLFFLQFLLRPNNINNKENYNYYRLKILIKKIVEKDLSNLKLTINNKNQKEEINKEFKIVLIPIKMENI